MKDQIKVKPDPKKLLFPIPEITRLQVIMIGVRFLLIINPRIFLVSMDLITRITIMLTRNPRATFPILANGRTIKKLQTYSILLISQPIIPMRSLFLKTISTSAAKQITKTTTTLFGTTTIQIIFKTKLLIHHQTLTKTLEDLTIILLLFSLLPWKITPNFFPLLMLSSPIPTPPFLKTTNTQSKTNQVSRIINR